MNKQELLEKLQWIDNKMKTLSSIRKTFCHDCSREIDCSASHIPGCSDCPYSVFYNDVEAALDDAIGQHNNIAWQLEKISDE